MSDYTRTFLDEAAELARGLPVDTIDAIVDGLAAVRERRRAAVHPRRRRRRGPRLARGQRLPQDRPPRELHADRQRLRAHRAHQRRRLGDGLRRVAEGLADQRARTRCWSSASAAARASTTSPPTSSPRSTSRARSARRSTASSARPTARRRSVADACVVVPAPAERRTPQVEAFQAVVWHLVVSHPRLAAQAGKWESLE